MLWYREAMDRRVLLAMALLTLGGMALIVDRAAAGVSQALGLLAVLAATAAWGADNTLSRGVADRDPGQVVMYKGALGAMATAALARAIDEPVPVAWQAAALLAVGATGYGLAGAVLMILGIVLHLVERHEHEHQHDELAHEHAHRHDDGHHTHAHGHDAPPAGAVHSHPHRHEPMRHAHPHVPDEHHRHAH
jgi:hypothetical protein